MSKVQNLSKLNIYILLYLTELKPVTRVPNGAHDDNQAMSFGVSVTGNKLMIKKALEQAYSLLSSIIVDLNQILGKECVSNQVNLF